MRMESTIFWVVHIRDGIDCLWADHFCIFNGGIDHLGDGIERVFLDCPMDYDFPSFAGIMLVPTVFSPLGPQSINWRGAFITCRLSLLGWIFLVVAMWWGCQRMPRRRGSSTKSSTPKKTFDEIDLDFELPPSLQPLVKPTRGDYHGFCSSALHKYG